MTHYQMHPWEQFLQDYSVETTPRAATKIPDYRCLLRPGTNVYVTLLPDSAIADTLNVCERLRHEGFNPTPHYAARHIRNRKQLSDSLLRFRDDCGGTQVLAIAGGAPCALGEFDNTMQLLETGLFDQFGIKRIGIAGHPEGSPDISAESIDAALRWKQQFAERTDAQIHLVTQFCFAAEPVIQWQQKLLDAGNELPIHIGIPGVASVASLLKHAANCGIGNSVQYLKKQALRSTKLLTQSTPQKILDDLTVYCLSNPDSQIEKIHVFPLGGLQKSVEWIEQYRLSCLAASDTASLRCEPV